MSNYLNYVVGWTGWLSLKTIPLPLVVDQDNRHEIPATNKADKKQDLLIGVLAKGANSNLPGKPKDIFIHYGKKMDLVTGDQVYIVPMIDSLPVQTVDGSSEKETIEVTTQEDSSKVFMPTGQQTIEMSVNMLYDKTNDVQNDFFKSHFRTASADASGDVTFIAKEEKTFALYLNSLFHDPAQDLGFASFVQINTVPINMPQGEAVQIEASLTMSPLLNPTRIENQRV